MPVNTGIQKQKNVIVDVIDDKKQIPQNVVIASHVTAQYIFLLAESTSDFIDERTITIGENAQVDVFLCYFGGCNVTVKLRYDIARNAWVNHKLLFFGACQQRLFFDEQYIFKSTNAYGRFSVQGLVTDEAQSNAVGNIMILPGAQKTDSRLTMSGHLLSRAAKMIMVPSLKVQANDVKAGHAGTVSQLNDEQLFYLQSRGLSKDEAKRLVVEGLFLEFVKGMEDERVRDKILEMAEGRWA